MDHSFTLIPTGKPNNFPPGYCGWTDEERAAFDGLTKYRITVRAVEGAVEFDFHGKKKEFTPAEESALQKWCEDMERTAFS